MSEKAAYFGTERPPQVCSGTGDWVVAQAAGDLESNWVASDLLRGDKRS